MTFWIYNTGLAVPISEKRIYQLNKAIPLEELSKLTKSNKLADQHDRSVDGFKHYQKDIQKLKEKKQDRKRHSLNHHDSILPSSNFSTSKDNPYQSKELDKNIYLAEHLMSRPVHSIQQSISIRETWNIFNEQRYRHLTVVDSEKKLVGIIADRDILKLVANNQFKSSAAILDKPIHTIMIKHVLTAEAKTLIKEICRVMFVQHVGAMPITSQTGKVLGIITRSDILRAMIKARPLDLWL